MMNMEMITEMSIMRMIITMITIIVIPIVSGDSIGGVSSMITTIRFSMMTSTIIPELLYI